MKPDLILVWPKNCDYPLYREWLLRNKTRFQKVIIVFTEAPGTHDYSPWLMSDLQKILDNYYIGYSNLVQPGEDWRDVGVRQALKESSSEWVVFSEEDFFAFPPFWDYVHKKRIQGFDVIGVYQETRLHPCFTMIKRSLLDTLKLDFSAKPPAYDHFGFIQQQLDEKSIKIAHVPDAYYRHYNGLSHNFRLVTEGQRAVYKEDEFIAYLHESLDAEVEQNPEFVKVAKSAISAVLAVNNG